MRRRIIGIGAVAVLLGPVTAGTSLGSETATAPNASESAWVSPAAHASAGIAGASRQTLDANFTTARRHANTGLRVAIDYVNPEDPQAKPYAVQKVTLRLARGSRINTSVPAKCTATDAELIALGADACPARSKVGRNVFAVDTGAPDPAGVVVSEATLLNNTGELILVSEPRDAPGVRIITRAQVTRRSITIEVPPVPAGPPDFFLAVKWARMSLKAVSAGGRNYITTPPRCPDRRYWLIRTHFAYHDGVEQQRASRTTCR